MKLKRAILVPFSLLTVLPVLRTEKVSLHELRESCRFFPLVGLFLGGVSSAGLYFASTIFSKEVCALVYLSLLIILTGGFHLDGLSDTFDGFSIKSSGDKKLDIERRLKVMSSGTQGPCGSLSVILVILYKLFLVRDILSFEEHLKIFVLLPVFSRTCLVYSIYSGRKAKTEGLGSLLVGEIGLRDFILSIILNFFISILVVFHLKMSLLLGAVFLILLAFTRFIQKIFERRFGGLTGDTLGAINEITEVLFLLLVSVILR
ncbi:MAG: adenosylcobinamide-GDP ribazoletransferase [Desulfobacterota bacterium]|nr:adenosylcobinamide-GDP ribazoletransferase [Thermodesulfobacteriota bacterium]MDW8002840.1 adenosylcobinamide-GDP ribazoletransferase [Deltaproteobacteria bacterium]